MLRALVEAGYREHMAIASRSLFPYLTTLQALPDEAEPERTTNAQSMIHDANHFSIQARDNGYVPVMQQVPRPDTAFELIDEQDNIHSLFEDRDLLGQQDREYVERRHVGGVCKRADDPATNAWNSPVHYSTIETLPCPATCRSYVPGGDLFEPFPHVEHRRSWSQQPKAERMPPTIESSRNPGSTEVWGTGKRDAADEKEEARLLGRYSNDDAGAVLIGKPTSRSMPFFVPSRMPSGGPRPTNTLNKTLNSRIYTAQPARSKLRGGEPNQLQFKTSRGSNVTGVLHASSYEEEAFVESSPKRRKTSHYTSSPGSIRSADERLDQLDPATVTFGPNHVSQEPSQNVSTHSISSQGSALQKQRKVSLGGLPEHRNLEKMMRSKPASKKQQRSLDGSQNQQRDHRTSSSPPQSSLSNPIDISGFDKDQESLDTKIAGTPRPMWQGTARKPHSTTEASKSNISRLYQGRFTGKQSPFFDEPSLPLPKINGTQSQHRVRTEVRNDIDKHPDRLNDQFIPVNGDRRTSSVSLSSDIDELQSTGTTVGNNADTNPLFASNRSRNNSPSKEPNPVPHILPSDEEGPVIALSNIRPERYVAPKPRVQSNTRPVGRVREKKAHWSVELAAISKPGSLISANGMALVHDEKSGDYCVAMDGRFTAVKIQPQKLLKILYEDSGRKVRFMSAKSGTKDNLVDLELRHAKDTSVLLDNVGLRVVVKLESRSSNHMEKVFEKRRTEHRISEDSRLATDRHGLHHTERSEVRRELDDRTRSRDTGAATNHRATNKVIDDLWNRSLQPDESPNEQQSLKSIRNGIPRKESIRQILADLKPTHNEHLTRSTTASAHFARPSKDPFDDLEDLPQVTRFSKTHGLGDPWKKPLTYPIIGKKKTTVEFSDLERLDEGEYLNDSLISFYLRFLEHTIEEQRPDLAKRVYFFNTFFFATLMNTHKGRKGFNYDGVQKWTRNVDLFTYDYIVIPINDSLHWYLAIICNLPALDRGLDLSDEAPAADSTEHIEERGPRSSSPTINLLEGDSVTLVEGSKEPDERGARNSFADLSLDVHPAQPTAEVANDGQRAEATDLVEEDREMLDGQLQNIMPGTSVLYEGKENAQEAEDDPIQDPHQPPKAAGVLRRGKRKSMPSVTKLDPRKPAIITFDSLGLARSSTIRILKDYLREEAKAKRGGMEFEAGQIKGVTASVIPLQENWYDCGLFLLGYVGKLLEDDPKDFITKVIRREYEVQKDWPNLKPSLVRNNIREQLLKLHKEQEVERQKERDASRGAKPDVKQGSKVETGPSRAISPARPFQHGDQNDRAEYPVAAEDPKEQPSKVQPATRDQALQTALGLPPYDFEGDVKNLMQTHDNDKTYDASTHEPEQELEEQQTKKRSLSFGIAEEGKRPARMPGSFEDEPSLVIIDSQSQQEEVPRSFHHSHPNQAAHVSAVDRSELPAEIQDSQQSETARHMADIVSTVPDAAEPPPTKKWDVQEVQAVLVESPREPKRRKIDHENVTAPTQRAEWKAHVAKATKERDSVVPDWAKQGSSRRKLDRKAESGNEVINID